MSGEKGFQWTVALVLFGVLFLGVSDTQLVAPLLPLIARDLGTTPGRAGIIVTTYSLAAAVFALIAGPLSDRMGRKRILISGLTLFALTSFLTYHVSTFTSLVILRAFTGLSAGTLSTCALSFAGDHYAYEQRGRAMGILSMGYFVAFVVGVPAGSLAAARLGWQWVFGCLSAGSLIMLFVALARLPRDSSRVMPIRPSLGLVEHFRKSDRLAGMAAAFLTSGGIVGFLTYLGAWLNTAQGVSIESLGLLFMVAGLAAVAASPIAGWLSDHAGKRTVIIWSNVILAFFFLVVARSEWGVGFVIAVAALSMAASARQPPLHALSTEIVGADMRGEYIAVRNAASQTGIAAVAAISAMVFDSAGFGAVALVAAAVTILVPLCCIWLREPNAR